MKSTTFVDFTCWDKQAEFVGETLKKGRPVLIEGRLKSDSWEDKNTGAKRTKLEITAQRISPLTWDEDGAPGNTRSQAAPQAAQTPPQTGSPVPDEDLPF